MKQFQFTIGLCAGLADRANAVWLRNRILRACEYTGSTRDGFDLGADLFTQHVKPNSEH